jgi:hypothetical protein
VIQSRGPCPQERPRYLGPTLGRFLSEDPAFLEIGGNGLSEYGKKLTDILSDPQNLNAYSLVRCYLFHRLAVLPTSTHYRS